MGEVTLEWTAPDSTGFTGGNGAAGTITKYTVYYSDSSFTDVTGIDSVEVTGSANLDNGCFEPGQRHNVLLPGDGVERYRGGCPFRGGNSLPDTVAARTPPRLPCNNNEVAGR